MIYTFDPFDCSVSPGGVRAVGRGHVDTRKGRPVLNFKRISSQRGITETRNALGLAALSRIRDCREQIRQGELALWLNASYAIRHGVPVVRVASETGYGVETTRKRIKAIDPRAFK